MYSYRTEQLRSGWQYTIDDFDGFVTSAGGYSSQSKAQLAATIRIARMQHANAPTMPPTAADLELASAGFDTATVRLLASATAAHLADSALAELEQSLRDHGHALLRTADVLAARRLRARGAALRAVR